VDELPPFSDEESKALHREIKLLEQRRDDAAKSARSHKERVNVINDHLHSIRQEIDHTNSLVAAKKGEVDTEEHLSSLSQREYGQFSRDASGIDDSITTKQKKIARCKSQLLSVEEELEKLKTDLNWNQEELEQWATAATKKEEENLILQKYTSADELKIKELALAIEDLTKLSVEKKSLLENEVTETRSNQTELEKLAERFKSRHDERRQLIQQWKDTIESMNNRDQAIGLLASQYADLAKQEDECKDILVKSRSQHEMLEVCPVNHDICVTIITYALTVYYCVSRMIEMISSKTLVTRSACYIQNVKIYPPCKNQRAH
jgi:chromosome segregation ATPase